MYSAELIQKTRETFEPKYGRELTQGEVEEIIDNMTGLAKLMIEMYLKDKKRQRELNSISVKGKNPDIVPK